MSYTTTEIFVDAPTLSCPRRVEVTLRQLYYLDKHAERSTSQDGDVIYTLGDRYVVGDTVYLPDETGEATQTVAVPL